ncbi:histidine phosphatase family protein [Arthrobacter castelli]|uniref:histidine phosphatase family protein n=1 Tax=Arthrobacter castelli TaxID=271431 RepID=UPI000406885E|nr:histidine phosphatase family protein [Arthrobacter castelli]
MSGQKLPAWHPARTRRRIILWRHGRTGWNSEGRFQGQEDIELDDAGREQAATAARHLQHTDPARIISSDLRRARDTAEALAQLTGTGVDTDARLRETYLGHWQGLTFATISERFPDEVEQWAAGSVQVRPGGGETRAEMAIRMGDSISEAAGTLGADETVVVVTHGGAARVAIAHLLGLPPEHWGVLSGLGNCNWSMLEEVEDSALEGKVRWRLTEHNAGTLPRPVTVQEG